MGHLYHGELLVIARGYIVCWELAWLYSWAWDPKISQDHVADRVFFMSKKEETQMGNPQGNLKNMDPLKNHATWWSNTRLFIPLKKVLYQQKQEIWVMIWATILRLSHKTKFSGSATQGAISLWRTSLGATDPDERSYLRQNDTSKQTEQLENMNFPFPCVKGSRLKTWTHKKNTFSK